MNRTFPCMLTLFLLAIHCGGSDPGEGAGAAGKEAGGTSGTGQGGGPASVPICDGTSRLRLRVFAEESGPELRGSTVRVENGSPLFALDGTCRYWMNNWSLNERLRKDQEIRTGLLDSQTASLMAQVFPLGSLDSLQDCPSYTGVADGTSLVIADTSSWASCGAQGEKFDAAWGFIQSRVDALWQQGAPLTGGIRFSLTWVSGDDSKTYPWPLPGPLAPLALTTYQDFAEGVSHLIEDPQQASALRSLRAQYLSDRTASYYSFYDGQKVSDGNDTFYVYFRDVTPYEGPDGLLPFWPPGKK